MIDLVIGYQALSIRKLLLPAGTSIRYEWHSSTEMCLNDWQAYKSDPSFRNGSILLWHSDKRLDLCS